MSKTKRVNFYLPQGLIDALEKEADTLTRELKLRITRNQIVVKILSDGVGYSEEESAAKE